MNEADNLDTAYFSMENCSRPGLADLYRRPRCACRGHAALGSRQGPAYRGRYLASPLRVFPAASRRAREADRGA
jgi:hypothetical protein